MIPIEKNVIVVDEQGNKYEATYPKRAKGLVKNGRARFIDENTICLACPPKNNLNLEDIKMSENNILTENNTLTKTDSQLTKKDIFNAINALNQETVHITEALKQLETVRSEGPGDVGAQARAQAIAKVVECREITIQQTLSMYMKMYDDALANEQAEKPTPRQNIANELLSIIKDDSTDIDAKENAREALIAYLAT